MQDVFMYVRICINIFYYSPYWHTVHKSTYNKEILCLILAIIFSGVYVKTKHFMMNNILGISFCIQSIEKISVGSYKIGSILLIGLFFYDIFWVFGTDVMVCCSSDTFSTNIEYDYRYYTIRLYCIHIYIYRYVHFMYIPTYLHFVSDVREHFKGQPKHFSNYVDP